MGKLTLSAPFGTEDIIIETGRLAKLAGGAVLVTMGETVVLVTSTGSRSPRGGVNFLPLTCEYIEKQYAAGRIPGGYFKRESRPGPWEILNARMIDRPMRPLFPKEWRKEIQIIATVLSFDKVNDPAICAMVGASTATTISDVPFDGPIGACRVALIGGEYVINPPLDLLENAQVNLIVAATESAVTMVEGEGKEASEEEMIDAIIAAHEAIKPIIGMQREFREKVGKEKMEVVEKEIDGDLLDRVIDVGADDLADALSIAKKQDRYAALSTASDKIIEAIAGDDEELQARTGEIKDYIHLIQRNIVRTQVVEEGIRIDGRRGADIRPINCKLRYFLVPTARPYLPVVRLKLWRLSLWVRAVMNSASIISWAIISYPSCCTTTFPPTVRVRQRCFVVRAAEK
jgi:polyribonucleotide nucleotidyltransferase